MAKSAFDAAKEVIGGLAVDSLAVGLPRVRQYDAKDMGFAAFAVRCEDWSAGAEVDLGLVPGLTFKTPEGELVYGLQTADEATDGEVTALEAMFGREILVNTLVLRPWLRLDWMMSRQGSQSLRRPRVRLLSSLAEPSSGTVAFGAISRTSEPGGALAGFGSTSGLIEPGGALAGFGAGRTCLR